MSEYSNPESAIRIRNRNRYSVSACHGVSQRPMEAVNFLSERAISITTSSQKPYWFKQWLIRTGADLGSDVVLACG